MQCWCFPDLKATLCGVTPWIQGSSWQEEFHPFSLMGRSKIKAISGQNWTACCHFSAFRLLCTNRYRLACSREPGVAWTRWSCPRGCGSPFTACTSGRSAWTWRRRLLKICTTTGTSASSSAGSWNRKRGRSAACTVWWVEGNEDLTLHDQLPLTPQGNVSAFCGDGRMRNASIPKECHSFSLHCRLVLLMERSLILDRWKTVK